jgi:mRNA-degrading endonuclease RelE of RelBE toxin-antitoxin system
LSASRLGTARASAQRSKRWTADPLQGDIRKLKGERDGFRRRVGDWRIFFDVYPYEGRVVVTGIERRTSSTY